jgi:hypothetical protein
VFRRGPVLIGEYSPADVPRVRAKRPFLFCAQILATMKIKGNIAYVPLGKGKHQKRMYAMIDLDEYERVARHKWYATPGVGTWYAVATSDRGLPAHHMRLQNFIMRGQKGERFDHRNGDGLDCRKENLRLATPLENARNAYKTSSPHVTSKFKGVRLTSSGRWFAQIKVGGVPDCLGTFDTEEAAARAYDKAAVERFGEFAKTNAQMGLFEAEKPNRNRCHRALDAEFAVPSKVFGGQPKESWQAIIEGDATEVDRSIDHRLRRKTMVRKRRAA